MSSQKPISTVSQRSQESDAHEHDDSFSSTGSVGGRHRPRASTSTIPLSVAYGALPNATATGEHASAARPISPQQSIRGAISPSPASPPASVPSPTPAENARQRYAALKDQKQAAVVQKQQEQLRQRQHLHAPGFITSPPVPNLSSMRDTTVGAATAIHSAGGVKALNAMYAAGGRSVQTAADVRPRSRLAEPPQTVQATQDEDEDMEEDDDEVEETNPPASRRGQKRPRSPVMDMIMSGAAKVKYVVKERAAVEGADDQDGDDREQSYDYAEEDRFVEEGSLMDVDADAKAQTKARAKRKRDADKAYRPGEEEEEEEEIDEDGVPDDDLADAASKKTRKRPRTAAENKAYRPSSEEPYASDEDMDTPQRRKGKAKPPTRLPFPANADMNHKNRRKSTGRKGRKSMGGDEDESMEPDDTVIVEEKQASQRTKQARPGIAQITPQSTVAPASQSGKAVRSSGTLAPPPPIQRARAPSSTLAPPVSIRPRSISPAPPAAASRGVSPSYVGPGHPAYAPFALRPDIPHVDSTASMATVEQLTASNGNGQIPVKDEQDDQPDDNEEERPPLWQGLMHGLVNLLYYTLIWPISLVSHMLSPGYAYGRDLLQSWSRLWPPFVFWSVCALVAYSAIRGLSSWTGSSTGFDAVPYPPSNTGYADGQPEMAELGGRVAQLEEQLRRAVSQLAASRNTAPAEESRLIGDVDQLWKRVYRMEDEIRERKSVETSYGSTLDKLATDMPALRSKLDAMNGGNQALDGRFKHIDAALAETRDDNERLRKELEATKSLVSHVDGFIDQTQTELRMVHKTAEQALAEAKRAEKTAKTVTGQGSDVNVNIVDARLAQLGYNTDLRTDHALFEYGSHILPQYTSPQCDVFAPATSKPRWSLFSGTPEPLGPDASAVIMPFLDPGHCWAFKGGQGSIGIRLHRFIDVDEIVLEAPPQPMLYQPDATPRQFNVWGYVEAGNEAKRSEYLKKHPSPANTPSPPNNQPKFMHLGTFEYDNHGDPIQSFVLSPPPSEHKIDFGLLVFTFDSNYGGDFTCLYRIRVHGEPSGHTLHDLHS